MSSRFCQWPTLEDEGANGITLSRLDDTASWAYKYSASTCCERLGCVGSTQCAVMHGQVLVLITQSHNHTLTHSHNHTRAHCAAMTADADDNLMHRSTAGQWLVQPQDAAADSGERACSCPGG